MLRKAAFAAPLVGEMLDPFAGSGLCEHLARYHRHLVLGRRAGRVGGAPRDAPAVAPETLPKTHPKIIKTSGVKLQKHR